MRFPVPWKSAAALALTLASCLPLLGCRSPEQKFQSFMERGAQYREQGKWQEALLEYRNALEINPKSAEVNFEIAQVLAADQKYSEALFFYRETHRLDPKRLDAELAEAALLIGASPDEAQALIDEMIEKNPSYSPAWGRRAQFLLSKKDVDGALAAAQKAVELDPKDPSAHLQVGRIFQARIQLAESAHAQGGPIPPDELYTSALGAFDTGLDLLNKLPASPSRDHDLSVLLFERARVLSAWRGHEQEAEKAYRALVEQSAPLADKRVALGAFGGALDYGRTSGNRDFLRWTYQKLIAVDPGNVAAWEEYASLVEQDGGSGADVYKQLLERLPKSGKAYTAYAGYLARQNKVDDAAALLQKAAADGIEPPVVLAGLADLYTLTGRANDAKPVVDRLQREYPDEPGTAMAVAQRAVAEGRVGDGATALRELNAKHESDEAQLLLAQVELYLNDVPAAAQAVGRAIDLHGEFWPAAERLRAQVRFRQQDWAGTLQSLVAVEQSGLRLSGQESIQAARCYYELGKPADGRHVLELVLQGSQDPPLDAVGLFAQQESERDPAKVRSILEDALKRAPGNPELLAALAQLDVHAKRPQAALARLDAAIAAAGAGASGSLYASRSSVRSAAGDLPGALDDAREAVIREPTRGDFVTLYVTLAASSGHLEQAAQTLGDLKTKGKLSPVGEEALARVYTNLGRDDEAVALYEQILSRPGETHVAGVKNDLAYLLARSGKDLDRALRLAQEAQSELPQSPEVADTLGFVYLQKGLYDPAIRQFEYAISLAESANQPSAAIHYRRAVALEKAGRRDEAASAYEKALELDPKFPDAGAARNALASLKADQSAQR
ncbi:MAG TPA: tetratricopeptide repeat protein [Myxococcota bacterium]|nr:tetratricopeptide repeat protein [Myxococcota bacterium]